MGEQPDILRALGRMLDERRATGIEVTFYETFLAVSWQTARQGAVQQSFHDVELDTLRAEARSQRGIAPRSTERGQLSELLRTLGQELSAQQVELTSIAEEAEGFRVSGQAGGRYFQKLYRRQELLRLSEKRQATRGGRGPGAWSFGARLAAGQTPPDEPTS